jgi:hypothetical protein
MLVGNQMKRKGIDCYFSSKKSISSSTTPNYQSTYVDCPFCLKTFPHEFIHLHVTTHNDDSRSNALEPSKPIDQMSDIIQSMESDAMNPLKCLMLNQKLLSDLHLYFILTSYDGQIVPQILTLSEFSAISSTFIWSAEIHLRNFDGYIPLIGSSSPALARKCALTLVTNIPSMENCSETLSGSGGLEPSEISIFKSMIQKSFRRGLAPEGTHLAFQMLLHSPEEFLRRLPIILIEDGVLHWAYPIVIWLMVALSKGYHPPFPLLLICLHIYIEGTLSKYQDLICHVPVDDGQVKTHQPSLPRTHPILASITDLQPSSERTIVTSILIRAAYGGMEGDIRMLRHSVAQWTTRFFFSSSPNVSENSSSNNDHLYLHQSYTSSLTSYFHHSLPVFDQSTHSFSLSEINQYLQQTLPLICSPSHQQSLFQSTQSFLSSSLIFDPTRHLVSEGIDFHCDFQFIPTITRAINTNPQLSKAYQKWHHSTFGDNSNHSMESQQKYLKLTVWYFRSAINVRKIADWNQTALLNQVNQKPRDGRVIFTDHELIVGQDDLNRTLEQKAQLAGLWRIICPLVAEYSLGKLDQLREKLIQTK